jgi:hypothetical protein
MSILTSLFSTKGMQEAALGTLRKSMEQGGLHTCIIRLIDDPDNPGQQKLDFELRPEKNLVLITQADLDSYQAAYAKTVAL